jgi:hypothetical protein
MLNTALRAADRLYTRLLADEEFLDLDPVEPGLADDIAELNRTVLILDVYENDEACMCGTQP